MIVFIDDILNGNIEELLGSDLYVEAIKTIVEWWAILPMFGIILAFALIPVSLIRGKNS